MTMTLLRSSAVTRCSFTLTDLDRAVLDDSSLHIECSSVPSGWRLVYAMIQHAVGTVDVIVDGAHGTLFEAVFVQAPNGRQFVVGRGPNRVLCAGLVA